jgi:hypothetical protein
LAGRLRYFLIKNKLMSAFQAWDIKGDRMQETVFVIGTLVDKYLGEKEKNFEFNDVLWMRGSILLNRYRVLWFKVRTAKQSCPATGLNRPMGIR